MLPSLYAWINIYASWDPYGNTQGIKISIVNEDKGGRIKESEVNIGEEVVSSLKDNESLGWVFFDHKEEGLDELYKGNVYATIVIPEDFSAKILTLIDQEPVKPELQYYVNEKINAIAPKITDKGATTIQNQITTSFVETVADKLIEVMHSVGVELDKEYPTIEKLENMILEVQGNFPSLASSLDYFAEKATHGKVFIDRQDQNVVQLQNLLAQLVTFNDGMVVALEELGTKPEQVVPEIQENLVLMQTIFADVSQATDELRLSIQLNKPLLIHDINQGIVKLESMQKRIVELSDKVGTIDETVSDTVTNIKNEIIGTLNEYSEALESLKQGLNTPEATLKVLDKIERINTQLAREVQNLGDVVQGVSNKLDNLESGLMALKEEAPGEDALIAEKSTR